MLWCRCPDSEGFWIGIHHRISRVLNFLLSILGLFSVSRFGFTYTGLGICVSVCENYHFILY